MSPLYLVQTVRTDGALLGVLKDDSGIRDGDEGKRQRLPSRVLCLSAVQSQVFLYRILRQNLSRVHFRSNMGVARIFAAGCTHKRGVFLRFGILNEVEFWGWT